MQRSSLVLFNPLPRALSHYAEALRFNLHAAGVESQLVAPNLEIGGARLTMKLMMLLRAVPSLLKVARTRKTVIVIWPIFGLWDSWVWRKLAPRDSLRFVIVHDPVPLRRQHGHSSKASRIAAKASADPRIQLVAHTRLAGAELSSRGIEVKHILPHPVLPSTGRQHLNHRRLLVAGQHKESRDLEILRDLGATKTTWDLQIVGRGWPSIDGWDVDARFVPEEELDARLGAATAVLIPYSYYFQSGIATRCFELGVPVVAKRHEFVESLYGTDWPGFVAGDSARDWLKAAERVASSSVRIHSASVADMASAAWEEAVSISANYDSPQDRNK